MVHTLLGVQDEMMSGAQDVRGCGRLEVARGWVGGVNRCERVGWGWLRMLYGRVENHEQTMT